MDQSVNSNQSKSSMIDKSPLIFNNDGSIKHRNVTEYTCSPLKKQTSKESEQQKSSIKSITHQQFRQLETSNQKRSKQTNLQKLDTKEELYTETNDLLPIKINSKLMHQNTGLPYHNPKHHRNLIDDLVDEKKTTKNGSPVSNLNSHYKIDNILKKSLEHSKSYFVLETNKSEKSKSPTLSFKKKRSNSNLNLSQSSNQKSEQFEDNNQPMSMNSYSSKFQDGDTIAQQIQNQTLLAVLGRNEFVPEAMPIYRRISCLNEREPEFWAKFRNRHRNIVQQQQHEFKEACQHVEIEKWKCKECHTNISKFNLVFDDNEGRVQTPTKIVYENSFLDDFRIDFISQYNQMIQKGQQKKPPSSYIIYNAYQPSNIAELREYMFYLMCKGIKKKTKRNEDYKSPFGEGGFKFLSAKLIKYVMTNDDKIKNNKKNGHLWFDSIFESGNLLQAQRSLTVPNNYNLFMQVDTNTRGHQQWFYFRVKGGEKNKEYTFNIMNFTKPGVTGGRGYKSNEYQMRIHYKSKQREKATNSDQWYYLTHDVCKCEYKKSNITRRKKDVIAAGADSDQEDWVEEAFQNQPLTSMGKPVEFAVQMPDLSPSLNGGQDTCGTREKQPKKRRVFYYYALQFNHKFEFDDDTVYFAFAKPITYTEIMEDIHNKERCIMPKHNVSEDSNQLLSSPKKSNTIQKFSKLNTKSGEKQQKEDPLDPGQSAQLNPQELIKDNMFIKNLIIDNPQKLMYYQRTEVARTMTGIPLYKIIISRDLKCQKKNQIVLITSRVHSGETPGSEVFKGIFDFITSDCREARYLRRFYTFVLVPCMNPDGVICGNYRNSAAGVDLNRQWINPEPLFHPEVVGVKNLMQQIKEEDKRQIWIFCDIHGHSKKKNAFFYGCNTAANGGFLSWTIVRLLPRILAQKTHMFNYKDSKFRVEPYKIGTARIVAWKQFQITHSFTLENSFYGYEMGQGESKCFTQEDYKDIGLKFTMAIYDMHFLWKDIKRELRITQGWLKPRTLYEMTGTPLAQKVAEETAAAKELQRKQQAIEQYEQYLKTFYNSRSPLKRQPNFVARNNHNLNASPIKQDKTRNQHCQQKILSENIAIRETKDSKMLSNKKMTLDNGQLNEDLQEAMKQDDNNHEEDFYYQLHKGLVKIQSFYRGHIARKKVQLIQKKNSYRLMIPNNNNVNTNLYEIVSEVANNNKVEIQDDGFIQRSNTDHLNKPGDPIEFSFDAFSQETTTQNLSIFGGKTFNRPKQDWREFFNNDELDKAYQIVEVEQRDESDKGDSSMGSNSNPSEDNLEEEEMYEKIYGIKNPSLYLQSRKKKIEQYVLKLQGATDQPLFDMLDHLKPKPRDILSESKGILKDKEIAERKNKSTFPKRSEKTGIQQTLNQQSHDDESLAMIQHNVDQDSQNQLQLNSSQKNFLRKNWQNNMMNRSSQSPIINKDINQDNVFYHATTHNQVATNPVRMIQQSYLKQQGSHKKENINQVIKDCFITKKMNTKSTHSNSNNLFSKQPQTIQQTNHQNMQWAPYQNNNQSMQGNKPSVMNASQRKNMLKSQGHSAKLVFNSPKKTGWISSSNQTKSQTNQYAETHTNNFYPQQDSQFQDDNQLMQQFIANTQYQMQQNNNKPNQREIIKASHVKQSIPNSHKAMTNEQYSIPSIVNQEQMNFTYNSNQEKIPIKFIHQDHKGHFQIQPQPVKPSQLNNNMRGVNSISVLQQDQVQQMQRQKMTPQYDSQEYRAGALKTSQIQNQYVVHHAQAGVQNISTKIDPSKKNKQHKHLAKVNPRSFMVSSGLITDHKEGLNSLFVTGKSEHSIPTQPGKSKSSNAQQLQVTNLQSVRNLVEQILLGPGNKLSDQQQIQLNIKNNQGEDGGIQQFVNINQYNMYCPQSRDNNIHNMKAMVQSSDGPILLPNKNIIVNKQYHHHGQKYGGSKSQNQGQPHFSQQNTAQIQSLQLQQPRGALHMQHQLPSGFIQSSTVQQPNIKNQQFTVHNKFGGYGVVKMGRINKLEAQDKIPVGLQSLMNGVPSLKPPVSAVSRHSTNLVNNQPTYPQHNFSRQTHNKRVIK